MLPLYLLTSVKSKQILIELKNGETLNGELVNCDSWMNLSLKNVVQTSSSGDEFFKMNEIYVRGNHIKYLRLPEKIIEIVKEKSKQIASQRNKNQKKKNYNQFNNLFNNKKKTKQNMNNLKTSRENGANL